MALAVAVSPFPATAAYSLGEHTVAPGETLSGIADRYGVPLAALVALNDIADADHILAGQVLVIGGSPAPTMGPGAPALTYTVRPGDTLSRIAGAYGVSPSALAAANALADQDHILVGQVLRVGVAPAASPAISSLRHRVLAGETLSGIAESYGVTVEVLAQANGIGNVNHVVEGSLLIVPTPGASSAAGEVREVLRAAAVEFGVHPSLVLALAWQESGWNQSMVSPAGAIGVMQVVPETGDWAAADLIGGAYNWRTSTRDNARVGVAVLHDLLLATNWDIRLSLAGYYQGLRSVRTFGLFEDTREYVENVLALAARME